jgi:enoyl-CoA hydratase/carnithine racemase
VTEPLVELSIEQGVAVATLNRPDVRNAISEELRTDFNAVLARVAADDTIVALVLTGKGKSFCAGGDVSAMRERMAQPAGTLARAGWLRQRRLHHMVAGLHELEKPTIAAVNGAAAGLGCDLALCCDFIVASSEAFFTMSYVQRGLIPDGGGMYFLPRRVGLPRAKELIFTARRVPAEEAVQIGMADRVVAPDELLPNAVSWAAELGSGNATAIALSKSIIDQTFELTSEQVFALGSQAQAICYTTDDHKESVTAFLNRAR